MNCPICNEEIQELQNESCPYCGTDLIKTDNGEYTEKCN